MIHSNEYFDSFVIYVVVKGLVISSLHLYFIYIAKNGYCEFRYLVLTLQDYQGFLECLAKSIPKR